MPNRCTLTCVRGTSATPPFLCESRARIYAEPTSLKLVGSQHAPALCPASFGSTLSAASRTPPRATCAGCNGRGRSSR
eukprot:5839278-Pleurochrysis_carterae.AAC.2